MTGISFAWYVDHHTLGHAGRYLDLHHFFSLGDACAATFLTFVLDDTAFATAGRTDTLGLHHAEQTLLRANDVSLSVTGLASLCAAAALGSCAVAVFAADVLAYLELFSDALVDLLQCEAHLQPQVVAAVLGIAATATASSKTSEASEAVTSKHIAKH